MTDLTKRRDWMTDAVDPFTRFDRMFDEWAQLLPCRRLTASVTPMTEQTIRVDEFREDDTLVIRAELPGIDPDPDDDVEVAVVNHMLTIRAQRRREEEHTDLGYLRRELRTGAFSRTLSLPDDVTEDDITAGYAHGHPRDLRADAATTRPEAKRIPVDTDRAPPTSGR